jgi:hypothetical protein
MTTPKAAPSYRDWSDINVEREYTELCAIRAEVPREHALEQETLALEHRIYLLEYEIHDRGLNHLY